MRFAVLVVCLVGLPAAAEKATKQTDPKKVQAAVLAYLRENLDDPDSLKVARWGPHDLEAKSGLTAHDIATDPWVRFPGDDRPWPIVRLRFRAKNSRGALVLTDALFMLRRGKVAVAQPNLFGDEWVKGYARKKEERRCP